MKKTGVLIWLGLFLAPMVAWSQPSEELAGVNVYGRPGYPKITVFVWGQAQNGVWLVEEETDLIELLTVAARSDVTLRQPERRSETYVKLYRNGASPQGSDPLFSAKVEEVFSGRRSYPALQDGDILVVETQVRRRVTWWDVSQIVGTVSSGVSLILLLNRL